MPACAERDPHDGEPPGRTLARESIQNSPPSQITPRPYQGRSVADIRGAFRSGARRLLFVSPTGSGKTIVFAYVLAAAVKRGRCVLILAHRAEILDQIEDALKLAGVSYGIVAAGHPETDAPVQIAMVATIARRLPRWRDRFDFIVIDEAHHAIAGSWASVLASQPRAHLLGTTATPERLDGRGLGEIFDAMVVGPSTSQLIDEGWLSRFTVFEPTEAPDLSGVRIRGGDYAIEDLRAKGIVTESAADVYVEHCNGTEALAFCFDIDHSKRTAAAFVANGIPAMHVDGETPAAERKAAIDALARGDLKVLTNVALFGEGVDVPRLGAVFMLRPTASLALYLQQVGRALRPALGKERALIFDFAGNVARHGLPDAPREWSLNAKPTRQRERSDAPRVRKCPACQALNCPGAHFCASCGADLRTPREFREIEMRLTESRRREEEAAVRLMTYGQALAWADGDEGRLRTICRLRGYRPGWVWHQTRDTRGRSSGART